MPEPLIVKPKLVEVPEIMPDRVKTSPAFATEIVLLAVKLILPAKELVASLRVPPARVNGFAPTVTLCRSKVAPLATLTAPVVAPKPLLLVMFNVPAETVVPPE